MKNLAFQLRKPGSGLDPASAKKLAVSNLHDIRLNPYFKAEVSPAGCCQIQTPYSLPPQYAGYIFLDPGSIFFNQAKKCRKIQLVNLKKAPCGAFLRIKPASKIMTHTGGPDIHIPEEIGRAATDHHPLVSTE